MVICQYFLQGRCHFGKNCRNQHVYNNDKSGKIYGGNQLNNVILTQISNEVTAAEKGKQWPLTCFAPIKDAPSLPGWHDVAPEEVRWIFYESHTIGSVNQAMALINHFYKNAEEARNALKHPKPETLHLLNEFLKGKKVACLSSSTSALMTSDNLNSTFRFDTALNNIFDGSANANDSSKSIFIGNCTGFQSQTIFGNSVTSLPSTNGSSNIFSLQQPNQNMFSNPANVNGNTFSNCSDNNQNLNQNLFINSNTTGQNIFQQQTESNIFSNNTKAFSPFAKSSDVLQQEQQNLFQDPDSVPSAHFEITPTKRDDKSLPNVPNADTDVLIHSRIEDLNEYEIKAFTSATFTFGNIPLKPPPKQYC